MKQVGLILEGGGMRGIYTAGVLDAFLDAKIEFPYVYGVSSGATIGSSFLSKQKERSKRIYVKWSQDKRFIGLQNFLREGSYFGMNFLFEMLPNDLEKFDYAAFIHSESVLVSCLTNCDTGESEYISHTDYCPKRYMSDVIRACNSLPIISPHVRINGHRYLDGFLSDPLPIARAIEDGNRKNVIVLTKKAGVEKKVSRIDRLLINMLKARYPKIGKHIDATAQNYLSLLKYIENLEQKGEVFIFRPEISRLESRYDKNTSLLEQVYEDGNGDAVRRLDNLKYWMNH